MSKEILSGDQISDLVKSSFEKIKSSVEEDLVKDIANSLRWSLEDEYKVVIGKFFKEEILPELTNALVENKARFLLQITEHIESTSDQIGKAIAKKFTEQIIGNSYRAGEVFKALF